MTTSGWVMLQQRAAGHTTCCNTLPQMQQAVRSVMRQCQRKQSRPPTSRMHSQSVGTINGADAAEINDSRFIHSFFSSMRSLIPVLPNCRASFSWQGSAARKPGLQLRSDLTQVSMRDEPKPWQTRPSKLSGGKKRDMPVAAPSRGRRSASVPSTAPASRARSKSPATSFACSLRRRRSLSQTPTPNDVKFDSIAGKGSVELD